MSLFRLPTRSNFYVLTFSLQNERDNLEFLTEIFTYELTVIDKSKEEKRLSIFNVETPLYMLFPLMTFKSIEMKWNSYIFRKDTFSIFKAWYCTSTCAHHYQSMICQFSWEKKDLLVYNSLVVDTYTVKGIKKIKINKRPKCIRHRVI